MKHLLALIVLFGTLTFAWTHPGGDGITYKLFMGFKTHEYTHVIYDGPDKTCTVKVPDGFKLFFAAKAYQGSEESGFSNEVTYTFDTKIELEK